MFCLQRWGLESDGEAQAGCTVFLSLEEVGIEEEQTPVIDCQWIVAMMGPRIVWEAIVAEAEWLLQAWRPMCTPICSSSRCPR